MTTNPNTNTEEPEQLQLPGIDWSKYEHREVPTQDQIIDDLAPDEFYEHLAQTLWEQFDIKVTSGQLKLSTAFARKSFAFDQMRQAAQLRHPSHA